jgi:alpha-glucosidase
MTLQDIFWAHPDSFKLFNTFPTVLLMVSTYKTNKYKMPLFEIVGVTSTQENFNVGFAFLTNEKEDNSKRALETCRSLLRDNEGMSKVIATDKDKSLMKSSVFVSQKRNSNVRLLGHDSLCLFKIRCAENKKNGNFG